jgi:uncharacterized SAM-binding protein YcdF (DUF218 family)
MNVTKNHKKIKTIILRIITGLITAGVIWAVFLSINMIIAMNNPPPPGNGYTVIILGCRVNDGVPSQMLVRRLNAALGFLHENEAVACVTTGGYGENQSYSEARVGKNWLIMNDIDESRIFLEDASVNTRGNLNYAYEIITQEQLPENVIIVSDGFHLWRATRTARDLFGDVYVIPAQTRPVRVLPYYWVREWLALTRDIIT